MNQVNVDSADFDVTYWQVVEDRIEPSGRRVTGVPLSRKYATVDASREALADIKIERPDAYISEVTVFRASERAELLNELCLKSLVDGRAQAGDQFVVYSPEGMAYWPPVTMDQARDLVADRSSFVDEPGWNITPAAIAVDSDGYLRDGREIQRLLARDV